MRTVIGLCGYAQVGKDTLADQSAIPRLAFADRLKKEVASMLLAVGEKYEEKNKRALRDLLVFWGRYRRQQCEDYWIRWMIAEITKTQETGVVLITDVRYLNEVEYILRPTARHRGHVIRLHRPNHGPANDEEAQTIGEIDVRYPDLPKIYNDGTPDQLYRSFMWLMCDRG